VKPSALTASVDGTNTSHVDLNDFGTWQPHQLDFTASSGTSTVCLSGIIVDSGGWAVVDAVSVRAI
jgi:hypothetical protein